MFTTLVHLTDNIDIHTAPTKRQRAGKEILERLILQDNGKSARNIGTQLVFMTRAAFEHEVVSE
jgi:hypothetical protein